MKERFEAQLRIDFSSAVGVATIQEEDEEQEKTSQTEHRTMKNRH
jgi:hypothetical protein